VGHVERQDEDPLRFSLEPQASGLTPENSCASFLEISEALHLDIFHQSQKIRFFDSFATWARAPNSKSSTGPAKRAFSSTENDTNKLILLIILSANDHPVIGGI